MSQGRRAGLLSVLGIVTGSVIHTLAAAFGLSAILATFRRSCRDRKYGLLPIKCL